MNTWGIRVEYRSEGRKKDREKRKRRRETRKEAGRGRMVQMGDIIIYHLWVR